MVVAGGADDAVFRVQERIGTLDDVTAAVMLLRGEIAKSRGLFGVQIADGDAAEQRNDRVAVAVKVNGRRSVGVGFFIGNVDLRIDAERQDFIRGVGIVAVVVNVGVALCHIGVFVDTLGAQRLDRQCRGQCVGRRGSPLCQCPPAYHPPVEAFSDAAVSGVCVSRAGEDSAGLCTGCHAQAERSSQQQEGQSSNTFPIFIKISSVYLFFKVWLGGLCEPGVKSQLKRFLGNRLQQEIVGPQPEGVKGEIQVAAPDHPACGA